MSKLLDKMKAAGSIASATILSDSLFFTDRDMTPMEIPILNIAFSGNLDGGLTSGLTTVAGPSKHFKSNLGLVMIKAYMKKHKDAVCLFYDSEFGITPEYMASHEIDITRVIHIPLEHIEQLKFDISKRLNEIVRGDKVFIFIDSIGNLASKKEVEDAENEKSVADMSRAKMLKSVFRIVTPHLTTKDIPMVVINHTYEETGMFPKTIVSGGTGIYYSSSTIWIVGRSQEKTAEGVVGWNFNINVEKSRFTKEKSKLVFSVNYDKGIDRWSGLLDLGITLGYVTKPKVGWYSKQGDDKLYREADTHNSAFWNPILNDPQFKADVQNKYMLAYRSMLTDEPVDEVAA